MVLDAKCVAGRNRFLDCFFAISEPQRSHWETVNNVLKSTPPMHTLAIKR